MTNYLLRERQTLIRRRLAADGRVMAGELAREFAISEDTIRRDLREMAAAGLCERVYGGALASDGERSLCERIQIEPERKQALATAAMKLIEPRTTVFFDAGSTNLAIARAIPDGFEMTAATNVPVIAAVLLEKPDVEVILIGGRLDRHVGGAVDAKAMRDADALVPDLLVLGACGIDERAGITAARFDDAAFKRHIAERSRAVIAAITTDKIDVPSAYPVAALSACRHIVFEHDAPDSCLDHVSAHGVTPVRADAEIR